MRILLAKLLLLLLLWSNFHVLFFFGYVPFHVFVPLKQFKTQHGFALKMPLPHVSVLSYSQLDDFIVTKI